MSHVPVIGQVTGALSKALLPSMSDVGVPALPQLPAPPPPPPSPGSADVSAAAGAAQRQAQIAGAYANVATSPAGIPNAAYTTNKSLLGA